MLNYKNSVVLHRAFSHIMSNATEFTYSTRKQVCPCGQSKNYTPLTSHTSGGKCHSSKCGQKFFPPEPTKNGIHQPETVYQYRDEQGIVLFETVRYYKNGEKSFYQRLPTQNGRYKKGLGNVRRVLYNLPALQQAIAEGRHIFLVEGEKDCETLKRNGEIATCNPMGAGKWQKEYNEMLRNAHVIILPDNDEVGKTHAEKVAQHLNGIVASLRMIDLPKLPVKGDVSDWLTQGHSIQELREISAQTPLYKPKLHYPIQNSTSSLTTLKTLINVNDERTRQQNAGKKWYEVEQYLLMYYRFFYNELTAEITISKHTENFRPTGLPQITDKFVAEIRRDLALKGFAHSEELVRSVMLANAEPFHPFKSFFDHLPKWNNYDHIERFAAQIKTIEAHQETWHLYFRRWFIALVACSLTGRANHSILLLQGEQGIGKSRFFNSLIPEELRRYYSGSESLTEQTADVKLLLAERLLLVLDEVESSSRADLNFIKSMVSLENIVARRPYGRTAESLQRCASFAATANSTDFLRDYTGSRRFLSVAVNSIDLQEQNLQQMYAQAYAAFQNGEKWWFDGTEVTKIEGQNEIFQAVSAEIELVVRWVESNQQSFMTTTEVLNSLQVHTTTKLNLSKLGGALTKGKFQRLARRFGKTTVYGWLVSVSNVKKNDDIEVPF